MNFPMTDQLLNYDVFPLVFPVGKEVTVHIRPTGGRPEFVPGKEYKVLICALEGGKPYDILKPSGLGLERERAGKVVADTRGAAAGADIAEG